MFTIQVKHKANQDKIWYIDVEKTIPYTYYLSTSKAYKFDTRELAQHAINILTDNNLYPKQLYSFEIMPVLDDNIYEAMVNEADEILKQGEGTE